MTLAEGPVTASDGSLTVGGTTASAIPTDCRCACGSLMARLTHDAIELKCRRCKRVVVLKLPDRQWRRLPMP